MGMNYYLKPPTQSRSSEIHLGKSSKGWAFMFRADKKVRDYPAWLKRIQDMEARGWTLVDEAYRIMPLDALLGVIQMKRGDRSHVDYMREHHPNRRQEDYWKDAAGHNFIDVEFS